MFFVTFMYGIVSVFWLIIFNDTKLNFLTISISLVYLTIRIAMVSDLTHADLFRAISFITLTLIIFFGILSFKENLTY